MQNKVLHGKQFLSHIFVVTLDIPRYFHYSIFFALSHRIVSHFGFVYWSMYVCVELSQLHSHDPSNLSQRCIQRCGSKGLKASMDTRAGSSCKSSLC